MPDRLLVRESGERLGAGTRSVLERLPGVAEHRGGDEVTSQLRAGLVPRALMELLESEAHLAVKPGSVERRELAVERVADQHVSEAEVAARSMDLLDDAGLHGGLETLEQPIRWKLGDRAQPSDVEVVADHRCGREECSILRGDRLRGCGGSPPAPRRGGERRARFRPLRAVPPAGACAPARPGRTDSLADAMEMRDQGLPGAPSRRSRMNASASARARPRSGIRSPTRATSARSRGDRFISRSR